MVGAEHEARGEYPQAAVAYKQAFESFSFKGRKGIEGANAVLRAADSYWNAFSISLDIIYLESSIEVLQQWAALVDLRDAPLVHLEEVRRVLLRLQVIEYRLSSADRSLGNSDLAEASQHLFVAFDALNESSGVQSDSGKQGKIDTPQQSFDTNSASVGRGIAIYFAEQYIESHDSALVSAVVARVVEGAYLPGDPRIAVCGGPG